LRFVASLVVAAGIALSGCIPALEPFYSQGDLVHDPRLLGRWSAGPGKGTWHVARAGEHSLLLSHESEGARKTFEGHLFQLGPHRFLDLHPRIPVGEGDVHWAHYLPLHSVAQVWLEGDLLRIGPLSRAWLDEQLARGEITIAHRRTESGIVLTATTEELRDLLTRIADDPRAFPKPERCEASSGARTICVGS